MAQWHNGQQHTTRETESSFCFKTYSFAVLLRKIVSVVYMGLQTQVHWASVVIMQYFPSSGQPTAAVGYIVI